LKRNLKTLLINKTTTSFLIMALCLLTYSFSRELFIDIPKGIGYTIEYSRIVRQFLIEKNTRLSDYTGEWPVVKKIQPPKVNLSLPFSVPTLVQLANSVSMSDRKGYGSLFIQAAPNQANGISEKLYETSSVTFCTFPWEFENGMLEVSSRDYQQFLPVYITYLGYQNKLNDLMTLLKSEQTAFELLLDPALKIDQPRQYILPPQTVITPPLMTKKVRMVRAKLGESILLMETTDGIWNTSDTFEKDTSLLFEAIIPGTYTVKFASTTFITDYFITVK